MRSKFASHMSGLRWVAISIIRNYINIHSRIITRLPYQISPSQSPVDTVWYTSSHIPWLWLRACKKFECTDKKTGCISIYIGNCRYLKVMSTRAIANRQNWTLYQFTISPRSMADLRNVMYTPYIGELHRRAPLISEHSNFDGPDGPDDDWLDDLQPTGSTSSPWRETLGGPPKDIIRVIKAVVPVGAARQTWLCLPTCSTSSWRRAHVFRTASSAPHSSVTLWIIFVADSVNW
jgi:hypothetical protein